MLGVLLRDAMEAEIDADDHRVVTQTHRLRRVQLPVDDPELHGPRRPDPRLRRAERRGADTDPALRRRLGRGLRRPGSSRTRSRGRAESIHAGELANRGSAALEFAHDDFSPDRVAERFDGSFIPRPHDDVRHDRRSPVFLACSGGGHAELLCQVYPALGARPRVWITQASMRSQWLEGGRARRDSCRYGTVTPSGGTSPATSSNSLRLVRRHRPQYVVTTGVGLIVPFCFFAWLRRCVVALHRDERTHQTSEQSRRVARTDRLGGRRAMVSAGDRLSRATLAKPSLMREIRGGPPPPGEGTLVAVGTHWQAFDRLLEIVDDAVERGVLSAPIIAQVGVSTRAARSYATRDYLPSEEMEAAIASVQYVVCHGGTGIVPRRSAMAGGRSCSPASVPAKSMWTIIRWRCSESSCGWISLSRSARGSTRAPRSARRPLPVPAESPSPSLEDALATAVDCLLTGPRRSNWAQIGHVLRSRPLRRFSRR